MHEKMGDDMKREESIRYEKPQMEIYRFAEEVAVGASPPTGGDIDVDCDDSGFDN